MTNEFVRRWMLISLALHLLAAIFSIGFQNSDEHFQILEFLHAYLGLSSSESLAIEYRLRLRPWLQPMLYLLPTQALRGVGIENPFVWAFSYRLISSLIGWCSLWMLARCVPLWIQEARWQRIAVIFLALTWYLPALHARHSSENLGGAFFAMGLASAALLAMRSPWRFAIPGFLLGLAFESRYQVGIMIAGLTAWLALRERVGLARLAGLAGGLLAAVALGTFLDRVGYGEWTFAPWNYLKFNLIDGHAAAAGVSPWWDYFRRSWTESWPVLGFLTLASMILTWAIYPWHVLTWTTLPFFVAHSVIGHKETRFLFPMVNFAPVMLAMVLMPFSMWLSSRFWRAVAGVIVALNLIALLSLSLVPAWMPLRLQQKVWDKRITTLHVLDRNPYDVLGIPMNFYRSPELRIERHGGTQEILELPGENWVASLETLPRCELVFSALPEWIPAARANRWRLYRCS